MPSRVNKGGAAPVVGGAEPWPASLCSPAVTNSPVWGRFSYWCWEPRRPWEPPLWCMSESLGVHIECKH